MDTSDQSMSNDDIPTTHSVPNAHPPNPQNSWAERLKHFQTYGMCSVVDTAEENLPPYKSEHTYVCLPCCFVTQDPRAKFYHKRDEHGQIFPIKKCHWCTYASRKESSLNKHMATMHGYTVRDGSHAPKRHFHDLAHLGGDADDDTSRGTKQRKVTDDEPGEG